MKQGCPIHAVCRPCALVRKKTENKLNAHSRHASATENASRTRDGLQPDKSHALAQDRSLPYIPGLWKIVTYALPIGKVLQKYDSYRQKHS